MSAAVVDTSRIATGGRTSTFENPGIAMTRRSPRAEPRSSSARPTKPSPLARLNSAERMALGIVHSWARHNAQSAGFALCVRQEQRNASSIAGSRVARLREWFAAAGQAERLAWLTKVATGEVVLQNDDELAELRGALARVVAIIRGG